MVKKKGFKRIIVIALLLSMSINLSLGTYEANKAQGSVVAGTAAMGAGGLAAISVPPLAIGVGVVAIAAVAGGAIYSKNSFEINNAATSMWRNCNRTTKAAWIECVKDFKKAAAAGEAVVDSAGNWIVNVPKSLMEEAARYSGNIFGQKSFSYSDAVGKDNLLYSGYERAVNIPIGLGEIEKDGYFATRPLGEAGLGIVYEFDGKWDYSSYAVLSLEPIFLLPNVQLMVHNTTASIKNKSLFVIRDFEENRFNLTSLKKENVPMSQVASIIDQYTHSHGVFIEHPFKIVSAANCEKIADALNGNYRTAQDNARNLGARSLALPKGLAVGAQGTYTDGKVHITWDGSKAIDGTATPGSWVDSKGNVISDADRSAVDDGIDWSFPKDQVISDSLADAIDNATSNVLANEKVNAVDDITDNATTVKPTPPPTGGDDSDGKVNWKKLLNLGGLFKKVFPFSIPFVLSDYLTGSFDGIEKKEFPSYDVPIFNNQKVHVSMPKGFYKLLPFIRAILLMLFDIGLLYSVHKWLGGLK